MEGADAAANQRGFRKLKVDNLSSVKILGIQIVLFVWSVRGVLMGNNRERSK